jgi:hypothetical protein
MFTKNFFILYCQSQEETGAAGGQLVSNKTDAYTIGKGVGTTGAFFFYYRFAVWLRNSFISLTFYATIPF